MIPADVSRRRSAAQDLGGLHDPDITACGEIGIQKRLVGRTVDDKNPSAGRGTGESPYTGCDLEVPILPQPEARSVRSVREMCSEKNLPLGSDVVILVPLRIQKPVVRCEIPAGQRRVPNCIRIAIGAGIRNIAKLRRFFNHGINTVSKGLPCDLVLEVINAGYRREAESTSERDRQLLDLVYPVEQRVEPGGKFNRQYRPGSIVCRNSRPREKSAWKLIRREGVKRPLNE